MEFYNSKYFEAYNNTFIKLNKCRALVNTLYRDTSYEIQYARSMFAEYAKSHKEFLDELEKNSLFINEEVYNMFYDLLNIIHFWGREFEDEYNNLSLMSTVISIPSNKYYKFKNEIEPSIKKDYDILKSKIKETIENMKEAL